MDSKSEFVPALCTCCGAPIKVDPSKEAAVCEYCGSAFVTSKAINKYNISIYHKTENNTFNVQVGRKGFAQSAFEFAEKYDENRAAVRTAKEKKKAEKAAAIAAEQAWQREQLRIKEEAKKTRWKTIGVFFLWLYFFPIMAIAMYLKRSGEKKQNEQRIANGVEPQELTPIPYFSAVAGAVVFLLIVAPIYYSATSQSARTYSNISSASTTTASQIASNQATNIATDIQYETVELTEKLGEGTYKEIVFKEIIFPLTNNWELSDTKEESLRYYAETEGKVAQLQVAYIPLYDDVYSGDESIVLKEVTDNIWRGMASGENGVSFMRESYRLFSTDNALHGMVSDGEGVVSRGTDNIVLRSTIYLFFNRNKTGLYVFAIGATTNTERPYEDYLSEGEAIVVGTRW